LERLGNGKSDIGKRSCIVIVEIQQASELLSIGVIVDAVSQVRDFKMSDIEEAPSFGGAIETDFIEGMGELGNEFVVMLNIDRVLSLNDLSMLSAPNNTAKLPETESSDTTSSPTNDPIVDVEPTDPQKDAKQEDNTKKSKKKKTKVTTASKKQKNERIKNTKSKTKEKTKTKE